MQRLALALILVAVAIVAAVAAVGAMRRAWGAVDGTLHDRRPRGEAMQKVAFMLLVALILYVSVLGGA